MMNYKEFELSIQVSKPFPFNLESLKEIETNQWVKNQWPLVYFLKNEGEKKAYIMLLPKNKTKESHNLR